MKKLQHSTIVFPFTNAILLLSVFIPVAAVYQKEWVDCEQVDCAEGRKHRITEAPEKGTQNIVTGVGLYEEDWPANHEVAMFAMGCFWGGEEKFLNLYNPDSGIYVTRVGYAGGNTPNPTYAELCEENTNHREVVQVVYDASIKGMYEKLLEAFFNGHNYRQTDGQGNDKGYQYTSAIFPANQNQFDAATTALRNHAGAATTIVDSMPTFYIAEDYHQQYEEKDRRGGVSSLLPFSSLYKQRELKDRPQIMAVDGRQGGA